MFRSENRVPGLVVLADDEECVSGGAAGLGGGSEVQVVHTPLSAGGHGVSAGVSPGAHSSTLRPSAVDALLGLGSVTFNNTHITVGRGRTPVSWTLTSANKPTRLQLTGLFLPSRGLSTVIIPKYSKPPSLPHRITLPLPTLPFTSPPPVHPSQTLYSK